MSVGEIIDIVSRVVKKEGVNKYVDNNYYFSSFCMYNIQGFPYVQGILF